MNDPASFEGTEVTAGIDAPKVSAWFEDHVTGAELPLSFNLVAGGRSNLTFEVDDSAGKRYVLRRPPTGHILPKAHDMGREFKIISALGPAGVPVPPALGLCSDETVNGAPFYVMGFVDGVIARTAEIAEQNLTVDARRATSFSLIDTLAQIHSVDPGSVGLGDLGRTEGYIARQLNRWYSNYRAANESRGGTTLAQVDEVHDFLSARIPEQGPASIVHGDYRLDNCIVSHSGDVLAVLDWELCTLGDPLADVGQLLVYWPEPGERSALGASPTTAEGFITRAEVTKRYTEATGQDLSKIDFYVAFAYWKLACILEGVFARYVGGAMGNDGFDVGGYPESIAWLADQAEAATLSLGD
ncbi:MAG TPA: phosphotransferase family protein [Acidimicrobiales bacterium]|nr:phosphotransferase family protein [Acidimicrobiales bacterium]